MSAENIAMYLIYINIVFSVYTCYISLLSCGQLAGLGQLLSEWTEGNVSIKPET